jgi:hypothetical protein
VWATEKTTFTSISQMADLIHTETYFFYGTPEKIEGMNVDNSKRKSPKYFIVETKQLLLKRFLNNYNGKLFNGRINGNLTVSEALSLWNISFETHNYYE